MRERYNFVNKEDAFKEERSEFANIICKLLYNQNGCDVDKAISNGKIIFHGLDAHVYDICELVDNYIPLMSYYELKTYGKRHFEGNESEYAEVIIRTKKACEDYYRD